MLRLVKTSIEQKEQVLTYLKEWHNLNEQIVPTTLDKDISDFPAYVKRLRDAETDESWVPNTTYWLTNDDELLGAVNIRHKLNESLLNVGGHIGYGVKPSARGKGLATKQLQLALDKLKELEIDRVLITCDQKNRASRQVIVSNGGQEDLPFTKEDGTVVKRFWIDLRN